MPDTAPSAVPGPLSGLLVVDLTHVLSGPYSTMMLADLGARVIKIEPRDHGDDTRTYGPFVDGQSLYYSFVNRGKESIALDLKADGDRAVFLEMVRHADVLVENFRPGAMQRLGFGWEDLAAINPRLIYASCSGFGQTGPYSAYPAYDTILQAMSGLMCMTGFPEGPPTRVGTSISDLAAGMFLFSGIVSALYGREKNGKGAQVDVAMFDSTLSILDHGFMDYVATGKPLERIGNRHPFMTPFDTFQAADGPFVIACGNDHLFGLLCAALDRADLAGDPRFGSNADRTAHQEALKQELERTLSTRPASHWLEVIHAAGVPVGPLLDVAQAAEHPQTAARNMMIEAGGIRMPGTPLKISGYPDPAVRPGAPVLDQHGSALRREFAGREAIASG